LGSRGVREAERETSIRKFHINNFPNLNLPKGKIKKKKKKKKRIQKETYFERIYFLLWKKKKKKKKPILK
jgi:hypothetical protein